MEPTDGQTGHDKLYYVRTYAEGWLGSRVVSVLDSGAEGPGFKSVATLSGDSLR